MVYLLQSAPKKRLSSKNYVPGKKNQKKDAKPTSVANTAPAATAEAASNSPAAPAKDPSSPRPPRSETASSDSGPSDGLWTLTLDEKPPAGMNLVVFLPVCPTQTDVLPVAGVQPLPQGSPSSLSSNELLGANAAVGATLNACLELVAGFTGQETETPLDLSKKPNSTKRAALDTPLVSVKSEPSDYEVSGQAYGSEEQRKRHEQLDMFSEAKRCKTEPTVVSPLSAHTASPPPSVDVKKAPLSPGPDANVWSSTCSQLTDRKLEKSIKMEMDI